jgi:hypothetical protein
MVMTNSNEAKTLLILNPAAGKGKGRKQFDTVRTVLEKKFKNLEIRISEYPGHIVGNWPGTKNACHFLTLARYAFLEGKVLYDRHKH